MAADAACKLVLVGDSRVGKTSLIKRLVEDRYSEVYTPTMFEKYTTTYRLGDSSVDCTFWDTSGSEAYDKVRPLAYKDVRVFLACFAVSEPSTLESIVSKWFPEIRGHCTGTPVILCGTQSDHRVDRLKSDYRTFVTLEQALAVGRRIGAVTYVETSAKLGGRSVQDALEVATLAALNKLNNQQQQQQQQNGSRHNKKSKNNGGKVILKKGLNAKAKNCTLL